MLCFFYIIISSCKELGYYALNIITDIACFCKRCGISYSKRYIKKTSQCFDQICLTTSCWSQHQDVGFLNLYIIHCSSGYSLVVIVYCNRYDFFSLFLTYYIVIQFCLDLMRCRNVINIKFRFYLSFLFLLFLDLLRIWYSSKITTQILEIVHIYKTDIWKSACILIKLIHESRIVEQVLIIKLAHCIHSLVHTIIAYADIVRQMEHLSSLALRSSADKTYILVLVILIF